MEIRLHTKLIFASFSLNFQALLVLFPLFTATIFTSLLFLESSLLSAAESIFMTVLLFHHSFVGVILSLLSLLFFALDSLTILSVALFLESTHFF